MFSRRFLLVLGLAGAAAGALASPSEGRLPAPGGAGSAEVLSAGSIADFDWADGNVSGVDEMELLLSLDGGKTFPLRITGEILPTTGRITWRVPALPAEHARLALRAGRGGEEESESILFVSDEFSIRFDANAGLEELFRVGREWRTREALEGSRRQPFEAGLSGSPADELRSASISFTAVEPPRSISLSTGQDSLRVGIAAAAARLGLASVPGIQRPRFVPLRS